MAATFVTNMLTAFVLSVIFIKPTLYTAVFIAVSVGVIFLATAFSHHVFENPALKNKVVEPEIKYIFLLLLVFIYFANLERGTPYCPRSCSGFHVRAFFRDKGDHGRKKEA